MDKWSEYQEYMQTDTIKIENQYNDLILYRGFCTLTWCNQYFLVLKDNILLMGEEFPYGEYETAKEVYDILAPDLAAQPSKTNNGKKFKYKISFDSAEGITEGMVSLTADEAKIVEYAMDTDNWSEFEKDNLTPEQIAESDVRVSLIGELVKARRKKGLSQKELEQLSGVKQPMIARIERGGLSTQVNTLIKLLTPLGMKLTIVPIDN